MVLDGNSIINRAYYGVRPLTTRDGFFTHAIFGFLTMLGRLLDEEKPEALCVAFDRRELMDILKVYGRMVAAGEWRDYALDTLADRAVFSIFRRTSEMPLYRIEKNPKLARRQGAYAVIAQSGLILKRGSELPQVLRVFDKALLKLAE